jgi:hypothetical protein
MLLLMVSFIPAPAWAEFSCPDGTEAACLDAGDKVCAGNTKCVDQGATCLQDFPCNLDEGFVCASEHDAALNDCEKNVAEYDALAKENVDLRKERLDRKNCVLNAGTLAEAHKCVRPLLQNE